MSGLTKKSVYADQVLGEVLSVPEGTHVSYADISKGIHKYIKDHNLKSTQPPAQPQLSKETEPPSTPKLEPAQTIQRSPQPQPVLVLKSCRQCESEIPADALYCDICGATQ